MAEHPSVMALRDLLILHSDESKLHQALHAYAYVLKDLIARSQPQEFWFREIITARAREIGVEIE